jgi:hypothetical protein
MLLKQGPLTANIDVQIHMSFKLIENTMSVTRTLELKIDVPGPLKVAALLVRHSFNRENVRMLRELKRSSRGNRRNASSTRSPHPKTA